MVSLQYTQPERSNCKVRDERLRFDVISWRIHLIFTWRVYGCQFVSPYFIIQITDSLNVRQNLNQPRFI